MDNEQPDDYSVTPAARKVLQQATVLALQLQQTYVTSEHILYCLLEVKSTRDVSLRALKQLDVDLDLFREMVMDSIQEIKPATDPPVLNRYRKSNQVYYSPKVKEIISIAGAEAMSMNTSKIATHHLLMGIVLSDTGITTSVFRQSGLSSDKLRSKIHELCGIANDTTNKRRDNSNDDNTSTNNQFEKYATDLTRVARDSNMIPVIGRSEEINSVIQTLLRKSKNNPVIIGEPGVGKTAIVEGLAQRIVSGDVPAGLLHKRIMTLDLPLMVAGTKYRGQFEERLTAVIDEVVSRDDIILFIDELHMMVGAGDADGALDASNILKPSLSRGELTVIGATTVTEYTRFIEKDGALERRFQQVRVDEPSTASTTQILYGIKHAFEQFHNVSISNECVDRVVQLCDRYLTDRNFPDKAIDTLDETCAYIRLKQYRQHTSEDHKVREAMARKEQHVHDGEFDQAIKWREIEQIEKQRAARRAKRYERALLRTHQMTCGDVERVVSRNTGIPINSIKHGDRGKVKRLQQHLERNVIGQQHAIDTLVTAIKRSYTGLSGATRPIGCFLFLGPTGVGKTHLTKSLTECLFDHADNMIRVDMSELMESHSVSKLIGSPPGYVGYDDATGQLTEQVRRKPYSVILFDEIEKAHPDVMNLLLQVLDEGALTDSHGRHINFRNTIIVLTSNIGAREIQRNTTVGFGSQAHESEDRVMQEAKNMLAPEFINRLDDIVMFNQLTRDDLLSICDILLLDLQHRMRQSGREFTYTARVRHCLVDMNDELTFGARPLRRLIARHVENQIADSLLHHPNTHVRATCKRNNIQIESQSD
jgi:ATP-dependent Clp protease ATP-binding subunit ClpC